MHLFIIIENNLKLAPERFRGLCCCHPPQNFHVSRLLVPRLRSVCSKIFIHDRTDDVSRCRIAKSLDFKITLDNNRSPSVGTDRRRLQLYEGDLFGFGDAASVANTNTNGSNSVDLSYTVPISPRNTTLSFNYGASSSKVIERPFDVLNIQSRSSYYKFTLHHPFKQTPSEEFAMGITGSFRQSGANFLDDQVPFPSIGVDAFRASLRPDGKEPDSRFFTWRGQGQWVRLLAPDTLLLVRGDMQMADRGLSGLEQFGLGGQETVRGYRQDAVLADSGILLSVEGRIPLFKFGSQKKNILHLTPFFEMGRAWNVGARPDPTTQNFFLGMNEQSLNRTLTHLSDRSSMTLNPALLAPRRGTRGEGNLCRRPLVI